MRVQLRPGLAPGEPRPRAVPARGGEPGGQRRRSHAGFAGEESPCGHAAGRRRNRGTGGGRFRLRRQPDEKEKLFLPYFSTKGRGTGLGLAIVSHIVAEHGAHIRVEDNQPAGARFTVEIPALLDSENGEPTRPPAVVDMKPAHPGRGRRAGIRRSLSGVLEDEGYAGTRWKAARPAWMRWAGSRLRAGAAGHLAARHGRHGGAERIQEMPFAERPVVVMISGHGTIETAVKATKLGAFDFLEKPLSIEKISVVVKNALEHRSLRSKTAAEGGSRNRATASSARACP
jgi:hypothetical protein